MRFVRRSRAVLARPVPGFARFNQSALEHTAKPNPRLRNAAFLSSGLLVDRETGEMLSELRGEPQPSTSYLIRTGLDQSTPYTRMLQQIHLQATQPDLRVRASNRMYRTQKSAASMLYHVVTAPRILSRAINCAKRHIRREVLFATGGTRKGSRGPRKYTSNSGVPC